MLTMSDSKIIKLPKGLTSPSGKPLARTTREARTGVEVRNAQRQLNQIGEGMRPYNARFLGCAAVYFYEQDAGAERRVFLTLEQTSLRDVNESLAALGAQRLTGAMLEAFGKKTPDIRQDLTP